MDDVWDDDASDEGLKREERVRDERCYNRGYEQGLDRGKQAAVQRGFDSGFSAGVSQGQQLGRLQGRMRALQAFVGQTARSSDSRVQQAAERFDHDHKRITVALCHRAMLNEPGAWPAGCQERFAQSRTGEERWLGLADLLGMQLPSAPWGEELQAWERRLDHLQAEVAGQARSE